MGYVITQVETRFCIQRSGVEGVVRSIRSLAGRETVDGFAGGPHFKWLRADALSGGPITAEELFHRWRWFIAMDPNTGDITDIHFEGEKLGDEDLLFSAIAPFVQGGSYIAVVGEDGAVWRWYFDGRSCLRQAGRLVFEQP